MKNPGLILVAAIELVAAVTPPAPPVLTNSPAPDASALPAASAAPAAASSPGSALPSMGEIYGKPAPSGSPSPTPRGARPTPSPDDRKGLDGVWEIAIQRVGVDVQYEHFNLKQTGNTLAGTYLTQSKLKYPLAGSVDGTQVRIVVTRADGSTILLEGTVDGTTDMIGMLTDSKERVPFTAAYRPKEKWMDNVNASPGGLGGSGGIPPK